MQIDIQKSPTDNVIALINAANSLSLTSNDVTLTGLTASDPDGNHGNTTVTVFGGPSGRYTGVVEVHYTRLRLTAQLRMRVRPVSPRFRSTSSPPTRACCTILRRWAT